MSDIIMSDIVIDIISDIRIYVDRPKYEIVSISPLDIRMILGLLMKLYREWAVVFVSRGELPTSTNLGQSTDTYFYIDKLIYSHIE